MKKFIILFLIITSCKEPMTNTYEVPKAKVSYPDFENLVAEVKAYREARLVNLSTFIELSKAENTIILDTRSKEMYDQKHIKGAVHLNFSDFSQDNLKRVIPNLNTTVLIYCNNNFMDDSMFFVSKVAKIVIDNKPKEVSLALNIPTYINLYGYGYKNVFELSEYVSILNQKIQFEGKAVF